MDAATTNKVLKNLNPGKVLSKMRKMRRKRKDIASSESTSSSMRKVHFNCDITMIAQAVHCIDRTDPHCMTPEEQQQERYYNKKELNAMFLKDLEEHLRDQVATGTNKTDGRGLEMHFAHNQRRKDQAERCFKAVVDKSHAIRTATSSSYSPMMKARRKAYADVWAEDLAEYVHGTEYTVMSRDWALAQAAIDEAEAKAICKESIAPASLPLLSKPRSTSCISTTRQGPIPQCQESCETTHKSLTAKSA